MLKTFLVLLTYTLIQLEYTQGLTFNYGIG
jgi:hypothetical protein